MSGMRERKWDDEEESAAGLKVTWASASVLSFGEPLSSFSLSLSHPFCLSLSLFSLSLFFSRSLLFLSPLLSLSIPLFLCCVCQRVNVCVCECVSVCVWVCEFVSVCV